MADWSDGYVTDIGYTHGYYPELNPLRTRMALLNAGWAAPEWTTSGAACELGFGQGMSINLHAAASATTWYGTDVNPAQAAFAQGLARASGADQAGSSLWDASFAEFSERPDLPEFDFIGLHGIWSWISDENRTVIVDFVRRKLRPGGVLYISYNTQPGWAAMAPMRDLLTEHAQVMGVPGKGLVERVDGALAFADALMAANPQYAKANPQVEERLKRMKDMSSNYLAHEYFNRDWQPMAFSRMAQWLAPAKLGYACSAHYSDHLLGLNFTAAQLTLLQAQSDPMFRETIRDFLVNQQFRRDYWVKGLRKLAPTELMEAQRAVQVMLVTSPEQVVLTVRTQVGEASMSPAIYGPVLAALSDMQSHSIGALWDRLQERGQTGAINFAQLYEAVLLLSSKGDVVAVQHADIAKAASPRTQRLNRHLAQLARHRADLPGLASPVTGGCIGMSRFEQLFALCLLEQPTPAGLAAPDPAALAQTVWTALQAQGQRLVRDGKPIHAESDNLAELHKQAEAFIAKRLPALRRLGVLD